MYVKVTNGTPTPYTIGRLRKDNPNVSFPKNIPLSTLAEYDVYPAILAADPDHDPMTHRVVTDSSPTQVNGAWIYAKSLVELSLQERIDNRDKVIDRYVGAVQAHLDEIARSRNYDSILSLCTYATSTDAKFAAEGQAGVEWRDAVWTSCYQTLEQWNTGAIDTPTIDDLIASLPEIVWPT